MKFDLDSKNVKNGKTVACYMEARSPASHSTWSRPEPEFSVKTRRGGMIR